MNRRCDAKIASLLVATALCLGLAAPAVAESADELLERGIYTEQTVGDLDAAIEIYTQVLEIAEANRPHVAQAQFRLAWSPTPICASNPRATWRSRWKELT